MKAKGQHKEGRSKTLGGGTNLFGEKTSLVPFLKINPVYCRLHPNFPFRPYF